MTNSQGGDEGDERLEYVPDTDECDVIYIKLSYWHVETAETTHLLNATNQTELCVCVCDLQLHVVSQSLHCVQVNSGLTDQKQPSLLPHVTFNAESVWQHSLRGHTHTHTHG